MEKDKVRSKMKESETLAAAIELLSRQYGEKTSNGVILAMVARLCRVFKSLREFELATIDQVYQIDVELKIVGARLNALSPSSSSFKVCRNCSYHNNADSKYCGQCASAL